MQKWNEISKEPYEAITFKSTDMKGETIYHTDCMLTISHNHAFVCLEAIKDDKERELVVQCLTKGEHK